LIVFRLFTKHYFDGLLESESAEEEEEVGNFKTIDECFEAMI